MRLNIQHKRNRERQLARLYDACKSSSFSGVLDLSYESIGMIEGVTFYASTYYFLMDKRQRRKWKRQWKNKERKAS